MLSQSQYAVVDEHVTQDKKNRETNGLSGHHAFNNKTVRMYYGSCAWHDWISGRSRPLDKEGGGDGVKKKISGADPSGPSPGSATVDSRHNLFKIYQLSFLIR